MKKEVEYEIPNLNFDSKKLEKYSKRVSEINNELDEIIKNIKKERSFISRIKKLLLRNKKDNSLEFRISNFKENNSTYQEKTNKKININLDQNETKYKTGKSLLSHLG